MHRILLGRSTTTPTGSQPAQTEESGKTLINFRLFQPELSQIQQTADAVAVWVLGSECHWEYAGSCVSEIGIALKYLLKILGTAFLNFAQFDFHRRRSTDLYWLNLELCCPLPPRDHLVVLGFASHYLFLHRRNVAWLCFWRQLAKLYLE